MQGYRITCAVGFQLKTRSRCVCNCFPAVLMFLICLALANAKRTEGKQALNGRICYLASFCVVSGRFHMKLAAAQICCSLGDPKPNLLKIRDFCRRRSDASAGLIVL